MWFHGSPRLLRTLAAGSTITKSRDVARVFSHKPTLVSFEGEPGKFDENRLRHNGATPGYLFEVLGVDDGDVRPHPTSTMALGLEWLTERDLELRLIEETSPRAEEQLSEADIAVLTPQARRLRRVSPGAV